MNTRIPLAAALLMLASTAMAANTGAMPIPLGPLSMEDPAGVFGPIQGIPPDVEWASPDCTHIPCRTKDSPAAPVSPYEREPGFIGPPDLRPKPSGPPPFAAKDFQKELADARADNKNPIMDMGDNRYGVIIDGKVAICGMGQCSMPRPMTPDEKRKFEQDAVKKAEDKQLNNSINADNPGFTAASTPPGARGAIGDANTPSGAPEAPVSGYDLGSDFSGGLDALSGAGRTGAGADAGGATGTGSGTPTVGIVDGSKNDALAKGYTYDKVRAAAEKTSRMTAPVINGGTAAFDNTRDPGRNVDSTIGNGEYLGRTQAAANGDAK